MIAITRRATPSPARWTAPRRLSVLLVVTLGASLLGLSGAGAATGTYAVTIQGPTSTPHVNQPFVLSGSVTPAAPNESVDLQRLNNGKYHTVAKTKLNPQSQYAFAQVMPSAGGYTYRVVKPKSDGVHQGRSAVVRVWVTSSTLLAGHPMRAGDFLLSAGGATALNMMPTGNLMITLTASGRLIWGTKTTRHPGSTAVLRNDGDLVVQDPSGDVVWQSNTGGHPRGAYTLSLLHTFNLVIDDPSQHQLWTSNTVDTSLHPNERLTSGQYLLSTGRTYKLAMETSGDLQLIEESTGTVMWDAGTAGDTGAWVTMLSNGDLVVYSSTGTALVTTKTTGYPGAIATARPDGNLVVTAAGVPLWASSGVGAPLGDDYPPRLRDAPIDSIIDPWRFYNRECVSFVAWRMNDANGIDFNDFMDGGKWGDAGNWDNNARALGFPVNSVPALGAIAQSDTLGHVAWVAGVGNGTVTIEDYNYTDPGDYDTRLVPTSSYVYIHVADLTG